MSTNIWHHLDKYSNLSSAVGAEPLISSLTYQTLTVYGKIKYLTNLNHKVLIRYIASSTIPQHNILNLQCQP